MTAYVWFDLMCIRRQIEKLVKTVGTQRAKFAKKVHKPSLRVNVISFELNGFNAIHIGVWVPWSPSDSKKS